MVAKSNALRKSAKEKSDELDSVVCQINEIYLIDSGSQWWRNLPRTYVGVLYLETLETSMILSSKTS